MFLTLISIQVYQAMNVMGMRRSGRYQGIKNVFYVSIFQYFIDEDILAQVKEVSADKKNNSLELNEFIKMIAKDIKSDATKNEQELMEAFK